MHGGMLWNPSYLGQMLKRRAEVSRWVSLPFSTDKSHLSLGFGCGSWACVCAVKKAKELPAT